MLPEIKRILYATDLGPGSAFVFRYALSLARRYQAQINILHAVEPLSTFAQNLIELHVSHQDSESHHSEVRSHLLQTLKDRLHAFCEKEACVAEENLVDQIQVLEGQPYEVIVKEATKLGSDMIVMGTHHHSVIGEALLGTTAQKVLHGSNLPVLLVRIPELADNGSGI